jgi:hypothetical protein
MLLRPAEEGNIDMLKLLLEQGVDTNARDARNQTSLHRALAKGDVDVVRSSCTFSMSRVRRWIHVISGGVRGTWGCTPLHRSSQYGHLDLNVLQAALVLPNYGADAN